MKQLKRTNIFSFDSKITFSDSLLGFEKALLDSQNTPYTIFFEFQYPKKSLKKVKEIILKHQKQIDFENLYFYNANDFVNIVLNKPIYLPKTVNLFINHSCVIGCNFCNNTNQRKDYLPLKDIQFFLSKYPIGDNINFNILGQ